MQTVCDKKKGSWQDSFGPLVYAFDPVANPDRNNIMFASLPSGISNAKMTLKDLEIEAMLKGQNSAAQPFCRSNSTQDGVPMPWFTEPNIPQRCEDGPTTEVVDHCSRGHRACTQCECGPGCTCRDLWRGRNKVMGKCSPVRMHMDRHHH